MFLAPMVDSQTAPSALALALNGLGGCLSAFALQCILNIPEHLGTVVALFETLKLRGPSETLIELSSPRVANDTQ